MPLESRSLGPRTLPGATARLALVAGLLALGGARTASALALERSPYLQLGTPLSMVVRWRTDASSDSRVRYGFSPGNLDFTVSEPGSRTDHEIQITGLSPATKYYYDVGSTTQVLAGGDSDHFFVTSPVVTHPPVRIWAIGDSGDCAQSSQACVDAAKVKNAYLGFAAGDLADVWLMLGDNAYDDGTDQEYTEGLFDVYPDVLRNTVLWPSPGNHEFGDSDSPSQTGPYYGAFTLPKNGEAGGVPSTTEAYYSFDYGNVHFVSLDSHDTSRAAPANPETNICPGGQGGPMYQWLCADLAATNQDWIIAYWHHPPYTDSFHHQSDNCVDSDVRLCDMRERFVPVLERFGADLVFSGHSHSYERSVLLNGHYGLSSTYDPASHAVDAGDGNPSGNGPYKKPLAGGSPNAGTVYVVAGSASNNSGALNNHPVMSFTDNFEGSVVIDIDGLTLDATWLDKNGDVFDQFRIVREETSPEIPAMSARRRAFLIALLAAAAGWMLLKRRRGLA